MGQRRVQILFCSGMFMVLLLVLRLPVGAAAAAGERTYLGAELCEQCHHVQYLSWVEKPHGKAFESLKPGKSMQVKKQAGLDPARDYTGDPSCLKCHTTGYGKPGGFVSLATTPHLVHVQCEACHGPGSEYVEKVMRSKFSFAHAEVDDLGHIGYATRAHVHGEAARQQEKVADPTGHQEHHAAGGHAHGKGDKDYGYTRLGDPPAHAHRHQGRVFPLDEQKAVHCTETCHNAESPTYRVLGSPDFQATFKKQVRKGVHRLYGLMFIHW